MKYQAGVISKSPSTVQDVWFAWVRVFNNGTHVWTKTSSQGFYDKQEAIKDMHNLLSSVKKNGLL